PKDVVVHHKCKICVPDCHEVEQTCIVYENHPKQVEQDVTYCCWEPTSVCDPCTGCCYTVCQPRCYTQKVKVWVCDYKPVEHKYQVMVCPCKGVDHEYGTHHIEFEYKEKHGEPTVWWSECVPVHTTVKVPVYTPVCAPSGCGFGCGY